MSTRSYPALDAMRGAAALSVLLFHAEGLVRSAHGSSLPTPPSHGYLAVDFFYMLSGFVIAHAYGGRLDAGWAPSAFLERRVRRLYPTALLALSLGAATEIGMDAWCGRLTWPRMAVVGVEALLSALLVPLLGSGGDDAFPLDGPLWSLSQELGANVVYGYAVRLGRRPVLRLLCVIGALGCAVELITFGMLEVGSASRDFLLGTARIAYAFPLGVIIQQAHAAGWTRALRTRSALLPVALLTLALACPWSKPLGALMDGLCVFLLFPLLLAVACESEAPGDFGRTAADLSFPLYATHMALRPLWDALLPDLHPLAGLALVLAVSLLLARLAQALLEPGAVRAALPLRPGWLRTG